MIVLELLLRFEAKGTRISLIMVVLLFLIHLYHRMVEQQWDPKK